MKPKDGTPPFYINTSYRAAYLEYDSDDDYTADIEALMDFDLRTGEQKLEPQHLPDTRFVLTSYQPAKKKDKPYHTVMVNDADTIISLHFETEIVLIRAEILINSHPFFKSGYSDHWSSNKLTTPMVVDGCTILYRYELQYEADGTTSLIGKMSPTNQNERHQKINEAQIAFERCTEDPQAVRDMFDEWELRFSFSSWRKEDIRALKEPCYQFICRAAHYLELEMLCGYPPKTYSMWCDVEVFRGFRELPGCEQGKILIIIKLVEWIHAYALFKALGPQFERLMLSERFVGAVMQFPHSALRIAKLIQEEEVFRLALSQVVLVFDDGYIGRDPE